jgi:hypothetical protein
LEIANLGSPWVWTFNAPIHTTGICAGYVSPWTLAMNHKAGFRKVSTREQLSNEGLRIWCKTD